MMGVHHYPILLFCKTSSGEATQRHNIFSE